MILSPPAKILKNPLGTIRRAEQSLGPGFPSVIDSADSGQLSWTAGNQCTWCDSTDHRTRECPDMLGRLQSMSSPFYKCGTCQAINSHPTLKCPFPIDYEYGREAGGGMASLQQSQQSWSSSSWGGWRQQQQQSPVTDARSNDQQTNQVD